MCKQDKDTEDQKAKATEALRFENGTFYIPPEKPPEPFVPDNGFDAPA